MNRTYVLNVGPQHPSTHGVLRLVCLMKGETVLSLKSGIGLLNRGTEKFCEYNSWMQNLGYMSRLD